MTLPPLPDTDWVLHSTGGRYEAEWTSTMPGYTDDQMQAYAAAAVAAERESCAKLCDPVAVKHVSIGGPPFTVMEQPQNCAAAIRARKD